MRVPVDFERLQPRDMSRVVPHLSPPRRRGRVPSWALTVMAFAGLMAGCVEPPEAVRLSLDSCVVSPDGALCDDGQSCTVSDQCIANVCVGIVAIDGTLCTDSDVCTLNDICDRGKCTGAPAPDNFPCTDGDVCTTQDMCQAGRCVPGPARVCDDGDSCTRDFCAPAAGCQFMSIGECPSPPEVPDAAVEMTDAADVQPPDAPPDSSEDLDGRGDAGDVGGDLSPDRPQDDDARPEAPPDGPTDRPGDSGGDSGARVDLRIRGGACDCAVGAAPFGSLGDNAPLTVLLAGLLVAAGRRRRPPAKRQG